MTFFTKRRFAALILAFAVGACAQPGWDPAAEQKAMDTIKAFKEADPSLNSFFGNAQGYAVFPKIGKGAVGLGGSYGEGTVYEKGRAIGLSSMTKIDLGLQLGGKSYSQIVFFKDQDALDSFKAGKVKFAADASAIAERDSADAAANYAGNVAVFTLSDVGMMFEASLGGAKFNFVPNGAANGG